MYTNPLNQRQSRDTNEISLWLDTPMIYKPG